MTKIGMVTCEEEPNLYDDDVLLYEGLLENGICVEPVIWTDKNVNYSEYSLLILRSVWDYHYNYNNFMLWLNRISSMNVIMYNSVEAVRYNINKLYLSELAKIGINIIPSHFIVSDEMPKQSDLFNSLECNDLIVKPLIGASSYNLHKISQTDTFNFNSYKRDNPLGFIVQKYMPEITEYGEISLVFYNKMFSHAVIKKSKAGDFRVQDDYGGTFSYFTPDQYLLEKANEVLMSIGHELLYSRVDCLYFNNTFYLMEVELIEPILYLHDKHFRDEFITAISRLL